jgi:3-phenylpropionate/trans-cinnamate dioxygenase ferredoxin component
MSTYDLGPADLAVASMARREFVDVAGTTHHVLVVRIEDSYYGIGDICSHADVSLSEGTLWPDECEVECPKHGSLFSVVSGRPLTFPATQPVPTYAVSVDGPNLIVTMP